MPRRFHLLLLILTSSFQAVEGPAADAPDYNTEVRPILSRNCFFCHGPDEHDRKADLRLDNYEGAIEDRDGSRAIAPEDLGASDFLDRIFHDDPGDLMPPPKSHKKLTAAEKDTLKRWVLAGATYEDHWAFSAPEKPKAPGGGAAWAKNPIDLFVHARLAAKNLTPNPAGKPNEYLRRVTLDLTGLPPTPAELSAFEKSWEEKGADQAVGQVVDELLDRPGYGERMALAWMDAARYGDTSVMHADGPREMWPWRDWVIESYSDNHRFDAFLREQLAGDLIENATRDQKIASGFNRNNATSDEGGAFAEELRVEYAVDRVKTTSSVFLGLSMECAQCHDHKYDPITQREYFQFFAYFNNTADPGMQTRKGNQSPVVEYTVGGNPVLEAQKIKELEQIKEQLQSRNTAGKAERDSWLTTVHRKAAADVAPPVAGLVGHYELTSADLTDLAGQPLETIGNPKVVDRAEGNKAVQFDGKSEYHIAAASSPIDADQAFTASYYIKPPKNVAGTVASHMQANPAYRGWDLWLEGGKPGTHIIDTWPGNAVKVISKTALKANQWNHVVLRWDASKKAAGVTIFIDGKKVETQIANDNLTGTTKSEEAFRIGSRHQGMSRLNNTAIADLRFFDRALNESEIGRLDGNPLAEAMATSPAKRTEAQTTLLENHWLQEVDSEGKRLHVLQAKTTREKVGSMKDAKKVTSMIMADNPANKMRATYILDRGQYDSPKKEEAIPVGTPEAFPPVPDQAPANRLGLAEWMLREDHPLTARVAVNRHWSTFFGRGLVSSVTDFGNQGDTPTHPQLLDWLARDFIESGWDVKRAIRQMVTSSTYRQSSAHHNEGTEADPENLLHWRGPRFRLQGEFIRDQALAVSGLLNQEVGGPGVKPYQPEGLWNEVSLNKGLRFTQDKGEKLYRKSMYIYWKRSAPHPGMTIFDAPSRETCVVQRPRTNTPLQALVTLNDVQFVEAARSLATHLISDEHGKEASFEERVRRAYLLCTSRAPTPEELAVCREVFEGQKASFAGEAGRAEAYLKMGELPLAEGIDVVELASWTVLANLLLNLDEVLVRG